MATTIAACAEGPSVATSGPDEELAGTDASHTERIGDPAGPEVRGGSQADVDELVQPERDPEPKPSAATTSPEADETTTTTEDDDEPEDGSDDDPADEENSDDSEEEEDDDSGSEEDSSTDDEQTGGEASLAAGSVSYVNDRRGEAGLGTLAGDPELTELGALWAHEMISQQNLHHNPDLGSQMPDGYSTIGENIAYSSNPSNIDGMWWESDGHRANILGESYTHMGVAFVEDDQGTTWAVQVFAG